MKYLSLLLLLALSACKLETIDIPDTDLQIRVQNNSDVFITLLEVGQHAFENVGEGITTDYIFVPKIAVRCVPELQPILFVGGDKYTRGIDTCTTAPIPNFNVEGDFKLVINSVDRNSRTFDMDQVAE
ncbi:MAG: hypothetical protein AAFO94_09370 [Bacteroidota bacterium]